jgi:hypothetical protein
MQVKKKFRYYFEILTVVAVKSIIFWDVMLYSPVYSYTAHSCETSVEF